MKQNTIARRRLPQAGTAAAGLVLLVTLALAACSTPVKQEVERPANLEVETYNAVSADILSQRKTKP